MFLKTVFVLLGPAFFLAFCPALSTHRAQRLNLVNLNLLVLFLFG